MNNLGNNTRNSSPACKKNVVDERFEQNAGVKIHKGKECYSGGSGFYAVKQKPNCPNVNDGGRCDPQANDPSKLH
jgi:hypothetical protein